MNEQKTGKNKIGARYLSNLEAELILPNYERIYYQGCSRIWTRTGGAKWFANSGLQCYNIFRKA